MLPKEESFKNVLHYFFSLVEHDLISKNYMNIYLSQIRSKLKYLKQMIHTYIKIF